MSYYEENPVSFMYAGDRASGTLRITNRRNRDPIYKVVMPSGQEGIVYVVLHAYSIAEYQVKAKEIGLIHQKTIA